MRESSYLCIIKITIAQTLIKLLIKNNMVDICGEPLNVGDKVSVRYDQLTRIAIILDFTKTKVIIGLDYYI